MISERDQEIVDAVHRLNETVVAVNLATEAIDAALSEVLDAGGFDVAPLGLVDALGRAAHRVTDLRTERDYAVAVLVDAGVKIDSTVPVRVLSPHNLATKGTIRND